MFTYSYSFYNVLNTSSILWESLKITAPDNSSSASTSIYTSKTADLAIFTRLIELVGLTTERNRLMTGLKADIDKWKDSKCCSCFSSLGCGSSYPGPDFSEATKQIQITRQITELTFSVFKLDAHLSRDQNSRISGSKWDIFATKLENGLAAIEHQAEEERKDNLKKENNQFIESASNFIVSRVLIQLKALHSIPDDTLKIIDAKTRKYLLEKRAFENFNNIMSDTYLQDRVNLANRVIQVCSSSHSVEQLLDIQLEEVISIWKIECQKRIQEEDDRLSHQMETERLLVNQSKQIQQLTKHIQMTSITQKPQESAMTTFAKAAGTAGGKEIASDLVKVIGGAF